MIASCSTHSAAALRASRTLVSFLRPASMLARYGREIPILLANSSGLNPRDSRRVRKVCPTRSQSSLAKGVDSARFPRLARGVPFTGLRLGINREHVNHPYVDDQPPDPDAPGVWGCRRRSTPYRRVVGRMTGELADRDRRILDFADQWWRTAGAAEDAIRAEFGMTATRYYQHLNRLLDDPYAEAYNPVLVHRLRRLRVGSASAGGRESWRQ